MHSTRTLRMRRLLAIVFVVAPDCHRHDIRSNSLVHDRALTDNECSSPRAYKHVSKRCFEVVEAVKDETITCGHIGHCSAE